MEFIFMLLFGLTFLCSATGLTIPKGHSAFAAIKRADSVAFMTRYGAFDHKDTQNKIAGSPHLRPIADVFMAMNSASPTLGRVSTPATVSPTPFFGGPGPLLLPSPALSPLISPTGSLNDLPGSDNTHTTPTPSKQFVVLGTIAGGILFFTFCIFLIMSPSCNGSFCGWGHLRRRRTKRSINQEKGDAVSWVDVPSPPPVAEHSSLESVKDIRASGNLATGHTVLDVVSALASTDEEEERITSKFSMCSSEYTSSCSSASTTDLASNSSTVKVSMPIRPPRPPTADSPALSDSVYLAFSNSDQPYVIVQPQSLTTDDFQITKGPESARRLLTSTEFATLYRKDKHTSSDSRHSRAKSAPSFSRRNRYSAFTGNFIPTRLMDLARKSHVITSRKSVNKGGDEDGDLLGDIDNDSDVQETMVRKVMKHRRSRSASGWAYPSRRKKSEG